MKELYRARSPIHYVDRLSCALILFQGLEDKVVPPNQSQMMADAVRAKGLPVEYLTLRASSTASGAPTPSSAPSKPSWRSTNAFYKRVGSHSLDDRVKTSLENDSRPPYNPSPEEPS